MTAQQRKALWICAGVVVAVYVGRGIIDSARRAHFYQQQQIREAQRQAYLKAHPPVPKTPEAANAPKAAAPAPNPAALYAGVWRGRAAVPGRGLCTLSLELHDAEAGHFTGFSTLGCGNWRPLMAKENRNVRADMLNKMSPAQAIISGQIEDGTIHLKVDKTLTANSNGCSPTSFILTPFAGKQLAAEWKEDACQGGNTIMQRARQ